MARAGDIIDNPYSRERILFIKTASDTGGELLRYKTFTEPKGGVRAEHAHPAQEKRLTVLAGEARVSINGRHYAVHAGDTVVIPCGARHACWNEEEREELKVLVELRPALKTELVLETSFGLARDGRSNGNGTPRLLQMAVLVGSYREEIGGLPRWMMKLYGVLAPVAEILGYRPWYPEYSHPATHPGRIVSVSPVAKPVGW